MNQAELVDAISQKQLSKLSKADIEQVLKTLGEVAQSQLAAGQEVVLSGLGKLKVAQRKARTGNNPRTGEAIAIPAKNAATFTAAKALKDALNKAAD